MGIVRDLFQGVSAILFKDTKGGHALGTILVDDTGSFYDANTLRKIDYVSGTSQGIDPITQSLLVVDYPHHEIHGGSHFYVKGWDAIDATEKVAFLIIVPNTPNKWAHMLFEVEGTGETLYGIYEGVSASASGTAATPINNNRNSSKTSMLKVFKNPSLSASGTSIYNALFGVAATPVRAFGSAERGDNELILKENTAYAFVFTSNSNGNNLDYKGFWYEHTNKNAP